ncbi:WhiB family transcriptional regulator [Streptomyces sp. DSM 44917]|uniref:WhiB family transcriptional regulator n=1 Tax=Streptomyces boetiae TaxID=3075541 RepID=A0ABU2L5L2_9ACTN|nr:WhiB family transcriptional regulator [Streptomyces sp. DSM 44917]MDT0306843.1 WhiB family transcriptional regulator [Streptomyces sp. DSM 44917]
MTRARTASLTDPRERRAQLVLRLTAGRTHRQAAADLGISPSTVWRDLKHLRKAEADRAAQRAASRAGRRAEIHRLLAAGQDRRAVAAAVGVSTETVRREQQLLLQRHAAARLARGRAAAPRPPDSGRGHWSERAACRGRDLDVWFSEAGAVRATAAAVCRGCPVRDACLDLAMKAEAGGHRYGIYGGLTPAQRKALARRSAEASARGDPS